MWIIDNRGTNPISNPGGGFPRGSGVNPEGSPRVNICSPYQLIYFWLKNIGKEAGTEATFGLEGHIKCIKNICWKNIVPDLNR